MTAEHPEELHALLAAAFNAGDAAAAVELYERDAKLVVPPGGRLVSGVDEIRDSLAETFALRPTAVFEVVGKVQRDGLALTHGRWSLEGRIRPASGWHCRAAARWSPAASRTDAG